MAVQVNKFTATGTALAATPEAILNVQSILWTGATTAGDDCVIQQVNGDDLWEAKTDLSNTYLGITFAAAHGDGVHARGGVNVSTLDSGTVYVYIEVP